MTTDNLNNKIIQATKWSGVSELVARLITPISTLFLVRILSPEAFGVVATVVMITSLAEIFADAGFHKYLIQHNFIDDEDKSLCISISFICNIVLSIIIWLVICLYSDLISNLVGCPGYGLVISIACLSIPIKAFSSIQSALFKRDFNFRLLFYVNLVVICVPLFVTIPCALLLRNYWALIIGTLVKDIIFSFLLTYFSKWKPQMYFSYNRLKEMLPFTIWSLIEAVVIWLTGYVDIFIVGSVLNQYYLGLYRTSSVLVSQILGLITASTTPILYAALSRLQNNDDDFLVVFLKFQKIVGIIVIPLGIVLYLYSDFFTLLILGSQWDEASQLVGLWGITSAFMIVWAHYCSEVYRAKGLPKLSVLSQILHIVVLWPTVFYSVKYGYDTLCVARSIVRFQGIIVNFLIMYFLIKISPISMIKNVIPSCLSSIPIIVVYIIAPTCMGNVEVCICLFLSALLYLFFLNMFSEEKNILLTLYKKATSNFNSINNHI